MEWSLTYSTSCPSKAAGNPLVHTGTTPFLPVQFPVELGGRRRRSLRRSLSYCPSCFPLRVLFL